MSTFGFGLADPRPARIPGGTIFGDGGTTDPFANMASLLAALNMGAPRTPGSQSVLPVFPDESGVIDLRSGLNGPSNPRRFASIIAAGLGAGALSGFSLGGAAGATGGSGALTGVTVPEGVGFTTPAAGVGSTAGANVGPVVGGAGGTGALFGNLPGTAGGSFTIPGTGGVPAISGSGVGVSNATGGFFQNFLNNLTPQDYIALIGGGLSAAGQNNSGILGQITDALGLTNNDLASRIQGAALNPQPLQLPGGVGVDAAGNVDIGGLGGVFNSFVGQARQDQVPHGLFGDLRQTIRNDLGVDREQVSAQMLDLLNQQAAPGEQRLTNQIFARLQNQGRRGMNDSLTGEAARGLAEGLGQASLGRQIAALTFGEDVFGRAHERALATTGVLDDIRNNALARQTTAAGGATNILRTSSLPFEMQLQRAIAASNAGLGVGSNLIGVNQQNTSPLDIFGLLLQGST